MKKIVTGIATLTAMFWIGGTTAFAAGTVGVHNFIDANGDGICDYCNNSCTFVDANGDGICDNYAARGCVGAGYTDANGDGICDNYTVYGAYGVHHMGDGHNHGSHYGGRHHGHTW